jgi:ornithine cyclodeaminase/alanine dehydrogenase-like protein (mu-crystallin family)
MLILTRADVERLLDLDALVARLSQAMVDLSEGRASVPPRIGAVVPARSAMLAAMPAFVPSIGALEAKLVSVFPHERPSHRAVIVCFDPETGAPSALMDGEYITAVRTAAGSALATTWLARPDARRLAILGTGVQARAHAHALARERALDRITIAGRDADRARALANVLARELGRSMDAAGSFADACAEADIICAATHADEPVVRREWLRPGTHVNSVGYNVAGREVDAETVAAADVVVESRAAALAPPPAGSTDLLLAIRDGVAPADRELAEIGEIIAGRRAGRSSPEAITLYKSVGVGVQDAAAATLVLEAAEREGVGVRIDL